MDESLEEQIQELALRLQAVRAEDGLIPLQEAYFDLRQAFYQLLFQDKHFQEDQYAWLLMNQDATYLLNNLSYLHQEWKQSGDDKAVKANYLAKLDDFKWIIATALLCMP